MSGLTRDEDKERVRVKSEESEGERGKKSEKDVPWITLRRKALTGSDKSVVATGTKRRAHMKETRLGKEDAQIHVITCNPMFIFCFISNILWYNTAR